MQPPRPACDSEMGAYVDDQTRPTSRNFERTSIASLPDDVVFDILLRVPAQDIHNAARFVCHKWYQTTRTGDFVRAHLQQSPCGLVILPNGLDQSSKPLILFATQKGRIIEKSNFVNYRFTGYAFSSCNGLVLEHHYKEPGYGLRITNPATNQHLPLPNIGPDMGYYLTALGMAYAVASKEYKVVRSFYSHSGEEECVILTVGVDENWKRRVNTQHLSPKARKLLGIYDPSSTEGFVHWAPNHICRDYYTISIEYVLTLNVETEIITQFPAVPPSLCGGETNKLLYCYLPMGSCLSLLIARANYKLFPKWDQVWVMKPETGEWTKTMSIDSESQKCALEEVSASNNHSLFPVGWLKFREVLVFTTSWYARTRDGTGFCIAYNVRTHEIESLELGFKPNTFFVHRNSLLWLDGC